LAPAADFLRLDAGRAGAHPAVRRKALCHGALRDAPGFAERFAKRAKPDIWSLAEGHAPETLTPRGFARRARPRDRRPVL